MRAAEVGQGSLPLHLPVTPTSAKTLRIIDLRSCLLTFSLCLCYTALQRFGAELLEDIAELLEDILREGAVFAGGHSSGHSREVPRDQVLTADRVSGGCPD